MGLGLGRVLFARRPGEPTAVSAKVCLSAGANYPERPSPSLVIALGALLSALLAAAFVWRKLIIKTLSQDDANKV